MNGQSKQDTWQKLENGTYLLTAADDRAFKDLLGIFAEGGHTPFINYQQQSFIFSEEEMKLHFPRVLPTLNQALKQQGGQQL